MSKRVILRLIEGSFEQGFPVILRIREGSTLHETEVPGRLPTASSVLRAFNNWQSAYDQWQSTYRIRPKPGQVTNFSCREIAGLGSQLVECFNEWLNSDSSEWTKIRDELQRSLSRSDEIQLIIQTEDMRLRQLPWQLWNLFSNYYTKAEIALSAPQHQPPPPANPTNRVKILAILGDSTGINVDQDRAILKKELPEADIFFLPQPQLQVLNSELWDQHWDILFFAGHSASQADGSTGQIYINQFDSLLLRDLKNALRRAISRGLQLAIFNSCDGLGLAQELADLNIPQTIVMRKPVPDEVAQEFLRHFLRGFASGASLYLAVREARERLQGLEDRFPCASWLPVICQNPALVPPTWQELRHPKRKGQILPSWLRLKTVLLLFSVVVIAFASIAKNNINSIYQEVLGRDAEPTAIAGRMNDLAKGMSPSEIRRQIANSEEAKGKINSIYQEVLGRDAEPAAIAGRTNDLAKGMSPSEIRSQTASSEEAKGKINSIYQEGFKRNAETYELKSQMDLLAEGATLSLIRAGIARTSSLLQNGNVISLECLGDRPGSKFLDGRAGDRPVALTAIADGQSTGTKWRIHVISDGVIALENQSKIPGSTWLNGLTYAETVNLAPNTEHPHTGTEWRIYVIGDGVIALENKGHVPGSTWLNGVTAEGKVNLVSYPNELSTGVKWRIIKQ